MVMYSLNSKYPASSPPSRISVKEIFNGRLVTRTYTAEAATDLLPQLGYTEVEDKPVVNTDTHTVQWNEDTLAWDTIALSQDQLTLIEDKQYRPIRKRRDSLLLSTDWSQLVHTAATEEEPATYGHLGCIISAELSAEYADYRQALRDLPENTTDPANPPWPDAPVHPIGTD